MMSSDIEDAVDATSITTAISNASSCRFPDQFRDLSHRRRHPTRFIRAQMPIVVAIGVDAGPGRR